MFRIPLLVQLTLFAAQGRWQVLCEGCVQVRKLLDVERQWQPGLNPTSMLGNTVCQPSTHAAGTAAAAAECGCSWLHL